MDVKRVLLLHTNKEYARSLAQAITSHVPEFEADVVSQVPLFERIRALRNTDADIVQADELLVNGVLAGGTSLFRDTAFVGTVRGWADYTNAHGQYPWYRNASIRARTRFSLRYASSLIFISEATRERFLEQYSVERSVVIGRPIDVDRYANGERAVRETFDVLSVTNLRYEEKLRGVKIVLQALEPLFEGRDDLRYRIAGDGKCMGELRSFLEGYGYSDRVSVLGHVDQIENEYASADAFVYVSFLDAYPTVVLEAQASGLPVVAGDAVGVPEVAGDAGDVCEPTPEGVRNALERVISDETHRATLSERSSERIATHNQKMASAHAEVWRAVLES